MRKLFLLWLLVISSLYAQTITPNVQLVIPATGAPGWDVVMDQNLQKIDDALGIALSPFQGAWSNVQNYAKGQSVSYSGNVYISLSNSNIGNTPTAGAPWQLSIAGQTASGSAGALQFSDGSKLASDANVNFDSTSRSIRVPAITLFDETSTSGGNVGRILFKASGFGPTDALNVTVKNIGGQLGIISGTLNSGGCLQLSADTKSVVTLPNPCQTGASGTTGVGDPNANGIMFRYGLNLTRPAASSDILSALNMSFSGSSGTSIVTATGTLTPNHCTIVASDGSIQDNGLCFANLYTAPSSSISRSISGAGGVLDDKINVISYGADKTGVTDSTNAFNTAIGLAASRGGVKVEVSCGTYLLNGTINITNPNVSLEGEVESCIHFVYTGTGANAMIKQMSSSGADAGSIGGFSFTMPNATSQTIGIWTNANGAYFHDINADTCTGGTAYRIDNGTTTNGTPPNDVSYTQGQLWSHVRENLCRRGWVVGISPATPTPDYEYFGYNRFLNLSASVQTGQVGFELAGGPIFHHSRVDLTCSMSSTGTGGDFACIKSSGNWDHNVTNLNGEWNAGGGVSGNAYAVQVTGSGTFANVGGQVSVRQLVSGGNFSALVPIQNSAAPSSNATVTMHQADQGDWDTGSYNVGAVASTPWVAFRDNGVGAFGLMEGVNINSPFISMLDGAGNKIIFGKRSSNGLFSAMTEVGSIDKDGNLSVGGNLNVAGSINSGGATASTSLTIGPGLANEDINIGTSGFVLFQGGAAASAFTIGGFTGGTDGRMLTIVNYTGLQLTINNLDTNSQTANRIQTLNGAAVQLRSGNSSATFRYVGSIGNWVLVSTNGGTDSGGGNGVVGTPINITGQSTEITNPLTMYQPTATGMFRVCGYSEMTALATSGNITTNIRWADGTYFPTNPLLTVDATSPNPEQNCMVVRAISGSTIEYATDFDGVQGSPVYSLSLTVEQLF